MPKTNTMKRNTFRELLQRAILETCDLWDKDKYRDHVKHMTWLVNLCEIVDISYSWEPEFTPIIVTWQLRVTLDSICNYCDVLKPTLPFSFLFDEKAKTAASLFFWCMFHCTMYYTLYCKSIAQTHNQICATTHVRVHPRPLDMLTPF